MSVKASAPPPLHGVFVIQEVPPPERYQGNLIASLEATVENVAGLQTADRTRSGPTLVHKQDGRNYLRLTEVPPEAEIHCSTVDCDNRARLLIDARDAEVLAFCKDCAWVEFALWAASI